MNQFLDIGSQIVRPRRSQQEIVMQRLRKRVMPLFSSPKKETFSYGHHVSLDPVKKSSTARFQTEALDQQNSLAMSCEVRDRTLNASKFSSKRAVLFDSYQPLKQQRYNQNIGKSRKIFLPKLIKKKIDFFSLSPDCKDELQASAKKIIPPQQEQLVTFYPFKNKKT